MTTTRTYIVNFGKHYYKNDKTGEAYFTLFNPHKSEFKLYKIKTDKSSILVETYKHSDYTRAYQNLVKGMLDLGIELERI